MLKLGQKICVLICISIFSGCTTTKKLPHDYIFEYYEALDTNDYKKAYGYMSHDGQEEISEKNYINYHLKRPYREALNRLIEYELINENINGDKAIVIINAKRPDGMTRLILMKSASHLSVLTLEGKDQLKEFFKKQIKIMEAKKSVKYQQSKITINLIKENNEWKLTK